MNYLAAFIGLEIDREINGLGANCTGYFLERVTTHRYLLRTVTTSLEESGIRDWSIHTNFG
jgi:hypothetical protein